MELLPIKRRVGDTITNAHLMRLASEGWSIVGVDFYDYEDPPTFVVNFSRDDGPDLVDVALGETSLEAANV